MSQGKEIVPEGTTHIRISNQTGKRTFMNEQQHNNFLRQGKALSERFRVIKHHKPKLYLLSEQIKNQHDV